MSNRSQTHVRSQLLSDWENECVHNVLGKGCFSLATGVAQLYVVQTSRKRIKKWIKKCCGAVCFVKDNRKKSFYIRIYDPKNQQMLWEQELYTKFKYNAPKDFFHTFEAHDCHVGLNFASEEEAAAFKDAIEEKLMEKQKRMLERERRRQEIEQARNELQDHLPQEEVCVTEELESANVGTAEEEPPKGTENQTKEDKTKTKMRHKNQKKKLTKEDVGNPSDFRHISHLSWSADDGPHMDRLDADMKSLLEQIGIKERSKVDQDTMDFIYDFVDKHGGANAVKEDFESWRKSIGLIDDEAEVVASQHPNNEQPLTSSTHSAAHIPHPAAVKVMDLGQIIQLAHETNITSPMSYNNQHTTTRPPTPAIKPSSSIVRTQKPTSTTPNSNVAPLTTRLKPRPPPPTSKPPHSHLTSPMPQKETPFQKEPLSPPFKTKSIVESQGFQTSVDKERENQTVPILNGSVSALSEEQVGSCLSKTVPSSPHKIIHSSQVQERTHSTPKSGTPASPVSAVPVPPPPPPPVPNKNAVPVTTVSSQPTCPLAPPRTIIVDSPRDNSLRHLTDIQNLKDSLKPETTEQETTGRAVLMREIRTGTFLRHVEKSDEPSPEKRGSIAAALMSELVKRKTIIQFSDYEESSDEFDDDWDD